jgi:hypothetical protein
MEPSSGITALAIAPNRKLFGMAERGGVSLFEAQTLRRRRTLMSTESIKHEILSIAFSGDSKMVLTVANTPESCLSLWTTDRAAKIVASLKFLQPGVEGSLSSVFVHQADFCPSDSSIVCVSGNRLLKLLKVSFSVFTSRTNDAWNQPTHASGLSFVAPIERFPKDPSSPCRWSSRENFRISLAIVGSEMHSLSARTTANYCTYAITNSQRFWPAQMAKPFIRFALSLRYAYRMIRARVPFF